MFKKHSNINLIYRGSRDSFKALAFHNKVDNKGAHVTLVRGKNGKIFGSYTDISMQTPLFDIYIKG